MNALLGFILVALFAPFYFAFYCPWVGAILIYVGMFTCMKWVYNRVRGLINENY